MGSLCLSAWFSGGQWVAQVLGVEFAFLPDPWQEPAKLALMALAGGIGAFLAAQFLVTFRKALFVAIVAMLFSGAAGYLIFEPELPFAKQVGRAMKAATPAGSPSRTSASRSKPVPATRKAIRVEWDAAKRQVLVDGQAMALHDVPEKVRRAKAQHPEVSEVIIPSVRSGLPQQVRKDLEKVCAELKMILKEESESSPGGGKGAAPERVHHAGESGQPTGATGTK